MHHHQILGFQLEMAGQVRSRGVVGKEEELGRSRIGCQVSRKWDWGLETGSLLCPDGISGLLREQNGYLKRIAQSLDGGLGASEEDDNSTMRE